VGYEGLSDRCTVRRTEPFYLNVVGYEVKSHEITDNSPSTFYLNVVGYEEEHKRKMQEEKKGFI